MGDVPLVIKRDGGLFQSTLVYKANLHLDLAT